MPTSCANYHATAYTQSGFYLVKNGISQIQTIYCDFSQSPSAPGYEYNYIILHYIGDFN